ncbi:MAG: gluconokinase [Chitinophagales bacterium]
MQEYIIGIDIGTGSAKAVAVNSFGAAIASSQFHYGMLDTPHSYAEQDPEVVWDAFVNCIREVIAALSGPPIAVSLSSCMHSLILVDHNEHRLTNLISWADTRSKEIADELRDSEIAEQIYRNSGTAIHAMTPLCKIIWFRKNAQEVFSNAKKFISIKEYIWHKLFNAYEIDQSIASATGLFNIQTRKWNIESLKICGIDDTQLSEIAPTGFMRKNANEGVVKKMGISGETKFCIGGSDGCLANLGSFATEKGVAAITIGTSGAVRIASGSPIYNFDAMIFNYILDDTTFVCGAPINNGGSVLGWLMNSFMKGEGENEYARFFEAVGNIVAGSQGLLFLPYINGERAPIWDEKSTGVYFGIKSFHEQSHFLRAGLEGVCYVLRNILEILEQTSGKIDQLNVSGGFIQSREWVQMLADVTAKKIFLVQHEDASAIGAAMFCMKYLKMIKDYAELSPGDTKKIEPVKANVLQYEKYYPVFKNLYPNLKESMHAVAAIR